MADQDANKSGMTAAQQRALPEMLEMVAEYEASDEHLEDELRNAMLGPRKPPNVAKRAAAASPLEHPVLDRKMTMELDNIEYGISQPTTKAPTAPDPGCMSPIVRTHPDHIARSGTKPTPNPNNPWYHLNLDIDGTREQLYFVLNSVRESLKTWNLEFSPQHFRAFVCKAKKNWDLTNPTLRQMQNGLLGVHEFLLCGPCGWDFATAMTSEVLEALRVLVEESTAHAEALIKIQGCSFVDEVVRTPLLRVHEQLLVVWSERESFKEKSLKGNEQSENGMVDLSMGGMEE